MVKTPRDREILWADLRFVYALGKKLSTPAGAQEVDVATSSVGLMLSDADTVEAANDKSFCGGGWKAWQLKTLDKNACENSIATDNTFKEVWTSFSSSWNPNYDIFRVDGDKLYLGDATGSATDGTAPAKRPTTIDTSFFYQKI